MVFSNKVYNVLKFLALVLFPAVSVLYVALSNVWGWPYATQVAATIAAVCAFLGTVLQISSANWRADQVGKTN